MRARHGGLPTSARTLLAWALVSCLLPATALAWEPFRTTNSEVQKGNEELAKGQLDKALAAYNDAAKRLPQEPGVHLDRGIALLKSGKVAEARNALQLATSGTPSPEVRAKAHYNLGLSFLQEADAAAKQEDLDGAQKLLREASDAFKSSLRAGPGNRDAAWNYELAKRRQVELEKKQQEKKEQEKQEQEKKDQEKEKDDQQKQDGQQDQDDQKQDDQKQDDQQKKDGQPKDEENKAPEPKAEDGGAPEQPKPKPEQQEPDQQDKSQAPQPSQGKPALPEHMQKALDALENSEDNLQKHQAVQRARQRPQRVEKDW